jgi:branched-chain amino acid aminotransferase
MSIRVHLGGRVVPAEEARISVLDRGFLYGDSVFETFGTVRGRPFALREHLDRLVRSAARVGIRLPPREVLETAVHETLAAAANSESRVRVTVSRGQGGELDPATADDSRLVVIVQPLAPPDPELVARGAKAAIVARTRTPRESLDPLVKSGNYMNSVLAMGEARVRQPGAHEAILLSLSGSVAEGSSSNVFAVSAGWVRTPALAVGILDGITRAKVLDLCKAHGIPSIEVDFMSPHELRTADEVFLTSSLRGVLPVTVLDGVLLGDGAPGPVTRRLIELYHALAGAEARA